MIIQACSNVCRGDLPRNSVSAGILQLKTDAMNPGLKGGKHSLLWLAILFSATSAQQELQPWQQCGGRSSCAESQCADSSWDEVSLYIKKPLLI
jgi:hypothetical protein